MSFTRNLVFISRFSDPFINTALGKFILTKYKQSDSLKKILFLSSSHQGVFIGQNQNCWAECNMKLMKKDDIPLIRRDTGGGACFVDKGNRLFSFIHRSSDPNFFYPVILDAFKSLGIKAELKGRNDIITKDKKISGSAFYFDPVDKIMKHHGTILHNVDKDNLTKYLTPNKLKLESKGIKSVNARITNLIDINPNLEINHIDFAFINSFTKFAGPISNAIDIPENWLIDPQFKTILAEFKDPTYIYNRNPEFTKKMETKFSFGLFEFYFKCANNIIVDINVYSDCLDVELSKILEIALKNEAYDIDNFIKIRKSFNSTYRNGQISEIFDWLIQNM